MTDLEKVLEFVKKRIQRNKIRKIMNYEFNSTAIYETVEDELVAIQDFIEELIDEKNQEGGDER
ncbi:MAG: hypothetical protein ACPLW7_05505 [Minisyncoccia bacterium]|jgi:hypothetical protein